MPDADPLGAPVVPNGVALCKLHHAAFDRYLIGIRPDCVVEVRRDILDDSDGPMLIHGLQGFHGASLLLPRAGVRRQGARRGVAARSRDFFVRYTRRPHDPAVAYAIATGIINRQEVPEDLLAHLALEFCAHASSEE